VRSNISKQVSPKIANQEEEEKIEKRWDHE